MNDRRPIDCRMVHRATAQPATKATNARSSCTASSEAPQSTKESPTTKARAIVHCHRSLSRDLLNVDRSLLRSLLNLLRDILRSYLAVLLSIHLLLNRSPVARDYGNQDEDGCQDSKTPALSSLLHISFLLCQDKNGFSFRLTLLDDLENFF